MTEEHKEIESVDPNDPELQIDKVKGRVEEWQALHTAYKHPDLAASVFTYRRIVYSDTTEEIKVICQDCGHEESVAVGEPTPTGTEWSILRSEGNELN